MASFFKRLITTILKALAISYATPGNAQATTPVKAPNLPSYIVADPDTPRNFGNKSSWLTIRTEETQQVAQMLGLENSALANWESGIRLAYEYNRHWSLSPTFVAPPIEGWTLIPTGFLVAADSKENIETMMELLALLSSSFGEAQYFGSHRGADYVAWFKAVDGKIVRGLSRVDGEVLVNIGETTRAELDMGYFDMTGMSSEEVTDKGYEVDEKLEEEAGPGGRAYNDFYFFDDQHPMQIAEQWSVNPDTIDELTNMEPATGIAGFLRF